MLTKIKALFLFLLAPALIAQNTATVNYTSQNQIIDGFGAADAFLPALTNAQLQFFYGQGAGQLNLSILRVAVPDNYSTATPSVGVPGDCSAVQASCASNKVSEMQYAISQGARIYATPWSQAAQNKTNASVICNASPGNGALNNAGLSVTVAPQNLGGNSWLYTFRAGTTNATAASNGWAGLYLTFWGFTGGASGNNSSTSGFLVTASTSTSVTVNNPTGTTALGGSYPLVMFIPQQAQWMTNFILSLNTLSIANPVVPVYAISLQNEPDNCPSYDGSTINSAWYTYIVEGVSAVFTANSISTLIFMPETSRYGNLTGNNGGGTCATTSACTNLIAGYNYHDYDAVLTGTNTVTADPLPTGWATGLKYWETEVSCGYTFGPSFCSATNFNPSITDGLSWGAIIDQRIAGDGLNMWLYWWLVDTGNTDNQGLESLNGVIAKRAYVLGQYAKFIRPGYYNVTATRQANTGVSVSAYNNTASSTLVIVVTNYTGSAVSQPITITNAPTFSLATPTITSATQSLVTLPSVPVTSNAFTYNAPAQSITTFVLSGQPPNSFYGELREPEAVIQ